MKLHFGGGYNQDGQFLSGNNDKTANQYKVAQIVRYENNWENFHISSLFWNEGRSLQHWIQQVIL